jgi:Protein of unknown function (DUF3014)
MTQEPADVDLDTPDPGDPLSAPRRRESPVLLLALAGVLVLALAGAYLYLRRAPSEQPAPAPAKQAADAPPGRQVEAGDRILLPPLDETDALVRQLVGKLSSHPSVAAWLTTDGLILNFVTVTARIANGDTPVAELKGMSPAGRFRTRTSQGTLYIDSASYHRYDRYEAISALDARGTARLYATLKPRVRDAYRRFGGPDDEFDPVLQTAIGELLKVPVVTDDIALVPKGIGYAFADARLERMSAAQKQLLRMGPQNVRAIQAKLRELAPYLGITLPR